LWLFALDTGDGLFYRSGLQKMPIAWKQDWERFKIWQIGETGFPLIDANMRELATTGFMSKSWPAGCG
jgi:deoxyribodipyrimidine photo-lyase